MNDHTNISDNHNDSNWDDLEEGPPLHTRIAFATAWIIIAVSGIIGNSLVIFVAVRFQKMNNVTNCFIVNLAITDIVFLAFCMPLLVVQYTTEHWPFNQIFCKLLNFISFISVLVTVLTLVAMTIDRYIYVVRPFENLKWRKPITVFLLSVIIWLTSCIFASPFYYHYGITDHDYHRQCALLSDEDYQKYFRIYTVTLFYFIPLIIIIISYTKLLHYVHSKENKLKPKTKHIKWSKKRRAVTKMVAIVTFVFSICWLPLTLYIISANIFDNKTPFLYYFKMIANSFAYLNSAINPILYAFLNRSFRTNCGSLFSEPSCAFLWRGEEERPSQTLQLPKRPPSTQVDRFSYQSTTHQSASSSYQTKRKRKLSTGINGNQLTPDMISRNDFSDGDYELSDAEYTSQILIEKNTNQNNRLTKPFSPLLLINEISSSNIETTKL